MIKIFYHGLTVTLLILCLNVFASEGNYLNCGSYFSNGISPPCDITFTQIPSFTTICAGNVESGIYTIKNNTPVIIQLNYIRLVSHDALANSAAVVDLTVASHCGTSLGPNATCNIQVDLQPETSGNLNRVLEVGVNTRQVELDAPPIILTIC